MYELCMSDIHGIFSIQIRDKFSFVTCVLFSEVFMYCVLQDLSLSPQPFVKVSDQLKSL